MAIVVQELRPAAMERALAFAKSCGCRIDNAADQAGERIVPTMSLIAADEEQAIVAAALCVARTGRRHRLELIFSSTGAPPPLGQELIDKVFLKLHGRVHKVNLKVHGPESASDLWLARQWPAQKCRVQGDVKTAAQETEGRDESHRSPDL